MYLNRGENHEYIDIRFDSSVTQGKHITNILKVFNYYFDSNNVSIFVECFVLFFAQSDIVCGAASQILSHIFTLPYLQRHYIPGIHFFGNVVML